MIKRCCVLVALLLLLTAPRVDAQSQVRYLAHSGYADLDFGKVGFDARSFKDARQLARNSADKRAHYNLAVMYHVRGQFSHARHWYHRAALFRHPQAAYNLGLMYYRAEGVEQDYEQAYRWMEVAAKAGYITAQLQLGIMIYRGEGAEKNPVKEAYWYTQAAMNGDPEAQFNLSVLYSMGEGVPHDMVNAYAWMKLANHRGAAAGTELLMLKSLLSEEQITAAETRFLELDDEVIDLTPEKKG